MKRLFLITALMMVSVVYSQQRITANVTQDAKLLLVGDDKGNGAGTLDATISFEMQGRQQDYGYIIVRPEMEYAELAGGIYRRYSANVGVSFNQWIENVTMTATVGHGFVEYGAARMSFGNNLQMSYAISKSIDVFLDLETVERKDLLRYESTKKVLGTAWRTSGKIGVKITIFRPR
jgi:hypothetical protein